MLSTDICDKFTAHAALQHQFKSLLLTQNFKRREDIWDFSIQKVGRGRRLLFLEFGVWQGYSMNYFATRFTNMECRFIGSDSFEGLPENWGSMAKKTFSTGGSIPQTNDTRVTFVKGWFQNSFDHTVRLAHELIPNPDEVLIHFDADIYSSTLFLLSRLYTEFDRYFFIFDEFVGHESRALLNFQQAYGAKVEFYARCGGNFPGQVLGELNNMKGKYEPT
jgi:hypothetical protein